MFVLLWNIKILSLWSLFLLLLNNSSRITYSHKTLRWLILLPLRTTYHSSKQEHAELKLFYDLIAIRIWNSVNSANRTFLLNCYKLLFRLTILVRWRNSKKNTLLWRSFTFYLLNDSRWNILPKWQFVSLSNWPSLLQVIHMVTYSAFTLRNAITQISEARPIAKMLDCHAPSFQGKLRRNRNLDQNKWNIFRIISRESSSL